MVEVGFGAIHSDVRPEWVMAALVKEVELEYTVVSSNGASVVSRWGCVLGVCLTVAEED